jgi:cold-inducible RNA-binding protein
MESKLFVGNLSFNTSQEALQAAFGEAGQVVDVFLPMDKMSGRPRGFAFITMGSGEEAARAIELWHGRELDGRALSVNEARPKEDRPPGGGGGGRSFGGGGRGGDRVDRGGWGGGGRGGDRGDRRGGGGGGGRR